MITRKLGVKNIQQRVMCKKDRVFITVDNVSLILNHKQAKKLRDDLNKKNKLKLI